MYVLALNSTHTPGTLPLAQAAPMILQSMNETIRQVSHTNSDSLLRRLTVALSDTRQLHELSQLSHAMLQFDLVALRPTDEKTMRSACCEFDAVDIVALALSERLPFAFKHSTISVAIHRGVYFEIDVAPLFRSDADARRNTLAQAVALVRATHGRNIIITCSAVSINELRTAPDLINLGRVLGLTQAQATAALTHGAARCVQRGRFRCTTRSLGVVELRSRTARDDAVFGIQDDDDDEEDDDDDDN